MRRSTLVMAAALAVAAGSVLAALPPAWAATPGPTGIIAPGGAGGTGGGLTEVAVSGDGAPARTGAGPAGTPRSARVVIVGAGSPGARRYDGTGTRPAHDGRSPC